MIGMSTPRDYSDEELRQIADEIREDEKLYYAGEFTADLKAFFNLSNTDKKVLLALSTVERVSSVSEIEGIINQLDNPYRDNKTHLYSRCHNALFCEPSVKGIRKPKKGAKSSTRGNVRIITNLIERKLVERIELSTSLEEDGNEEKRRPGRPGHSLKLTFRGRVVTFIIDSNKFDYSKAFVHEQFNIKGLEHPDDLLKALLTMWRQYAAISLYRNIDLNSQRTEGSGKVKKKNQKKQEYSEPDFSKAYGHDIEESLRSKDHFHVFILSSIISSISPFHIWNDLREGTIDPPLQMVRHEMRYLTDPQKDALSEFLIKHYRTVLGDFVAIIDLIRKALEKEYPCNPLINDASTKKKD